MENEGAALRGCGLYVVVAVELRSSWAGCFVRYLCTFLFDVSTQEALGKDAILRQEVVVCFQCVECFSKRRRCVLDLRQLRSRHVVEISIRVWPWVQLSLNTIEPCKQQCGKCEVGVAGGVRHAELHALRFWIV